MARLLVLGGGFGGLYSAMHLERRLRRGAHDLALVSNENYLLYTPLLPEAAAGALEPRHVVVPLRTALRRTRVVIGEVVRVDVERREVALQPTAGPDLTLHYDHLILALGSVGRLPADVPGLREHAVEFKSLAEAIFLRNHVLEQLEFADSTADAALRRASLTFVFVGGGYAGIEAAGELLGLARAALRFYPRLEPQALRFMVVEAAEGVLADLGPEFADRVLPRLRRKGIEIRLRTRVEAAGPDAVVLSDGEVVPTRTLVWTAGVFGHPIARQIPAARDARDRLLTTPGLEVPGLAGVWALGDIAAVPDAKSGGRPAPPTAQHALRQARLLARNLAAALAGRPATGFSYGTRGMLATLGQHEAVGRVLGIPVRGVFAWWVVRTYHLLQLPTLARKARVVIDWTIALFFPRDIAQLGSLGRSRSGRPAA